MTRSANEVRALATKAARGAGAPPGQAAMFGAATLYHLLSARDPAFLLRALDLLSKGPIVGFPQALMTVCEGSNTSKPKAEIPNIGFAPLLVSYLEAYAYDIEWDAGIDVTWVQIDLTAPKVPITPTRIPMPDALLSAFETHAAKTFVPDTAASRLSGAGAGLTDND